MDSDDDYEDLTEDNMMEFKLAFAKVTRGITGCDLLYDLVSPDPIPAYPLRDSVATKIANAHRDELMASLPLVLTDLRSGLVFPLDFLQVVGDSEVLTVRVPVFGICVNKWSDHDDLSVSASDESLFGQVSNVATNGAWCNLCNKCMRGLCGGGSAAGLFFWTWYMKYDLTPEACEIPAEAVAPRILSNLQMRFPTLVPRPGGDTSWDVEYRADILAVARTNLCIFDDYPRIEFEYFHPPDALDYVRRYVASVKTLKAAVAMELRMLKVNRSLESCGEAVLSDRLLKDHLFRALYRTDDDAEYNERRLMGPLELEYPCEIGDCDPHVHYVSAYAAEADTRQSMWRRPSDGVPFPKRRRLAYLKNTK